MSKYDVDPEYDRWREVEVQGITFRYKLDYDCDTNIFDDGDWYGELAVVRRKNDAGFTDRPDHFDGRARKLHYGRSYDEVWWQPPKDVPDADLPAFKRNLLDILEFGYCGVIVETDHDSQSLWGIESFADDHQRDVVCDLIDEILYRVGKVSADVERWVMVGAS